MYEELALFQEQLTALSNSRQSEDKNEVRVVAEQETDDISATELEPSASLGSVFLCEGTGNEDTFLNSGCCAGPRFQARKVPAHSPAASRPVRSVMHP